MELTEEFRARFVKRLQGKDYILYGGLMELVRKDGLKRMDTEALQLPCAANGHYAAVKAIVETSRGIFTGLGDATPENVNRHIAPHLLRMAETRAKARALREAVGIDMVAFEELADASDVIPDGDEAGATQALKPDAEDDAKQIHKASPDEVVVTFGKYNGKTLGEIKKVDPAYIKWLAENAQSKAIKSAARVLAG